MAKRRKRSKKWISRLLFLILLVVAVVVCYFVWDGYFRDKKPKEERDENPVVEQTEEKKEETLKEEEPQANADVVKFDGPDPNDSGVLTGAITHLEVSGDYLVVRVNIDQYLTNGSCEMNIVRGNEVLYTEMVPIFGSASTSTCEGFNVWASSLGSGKTTVIINMKSGEETGVITKEVEL